MMTRAEKLFCIRAQVQKAASEIEHGDTYASCIALGDALSGVLRFLEEEMPAPLISPVPEFSHGALDTGAPSEKFEQEVEKLKETRQALDILRSEPTKIKRR